MSSSSKLSGLSLTAFVERVADRALTPAAGSVAATLGALGAGLASMAFRRLPGEGTGAGAYAAGRTEELDDLRKRLLRLVDADAEAYAAWRASLAETAGPGETAKAAELVLEVPLEIMESSVAVLRLLALGVAQVPSALRCECLTAARSLGTAVECSGAVVAENIHALERPDGDDLERTRASLLEQAAGLVAEITASAAGVARVKRTKT